MKTNQYQGDPEPFSVPYSANLTVDRAEREPEPDRGSNSPGGAVAAAIASPRSFPHRTLIVCFTIWLIATQVMIFDQVKFDARARLLEQAARSLGGPQVMVPNEPPLNRPTGAKLQRL
jgi:hypothetical protein